VVGLREKLRELGYRENKDFVIGVRFTQGDLTALAAAARQLVQDGVDMLLVDHDDAAKAARQATERIPIISTTLGDPVKQGLIESFARPGGNLTGVADLHLELGPKRLEVFSEMLPGLKRFLFLYHETDPYAVAEVQTLHDAARRLGLVLVARAVHTQEEAQATLNAVQQEEIDGVLAPRCCALNLPDLILEATARLRLPTMFEAAFWVERGALASYGPDGSALGGQDYSGGECRGSPGRGQYADWVRDQSASRARPGAYAHTSGRVSGQSGYQITPRDRWERTGVRFQEKEALF
jgi:putative tryptophan/tyrosine transport system substrate-binding protein